MLYAKFQSPLIGQVWVELPVRDLTLAEAYCQGLELGWSLGREDPLIRVDLRLSKHPTERLVSTEQLQEWLRSKGAEPQGEEI